MRAATWNDWGREMWKKSKFEKEQGFTTLQVNICRLDITTREGRAWYQQYGGSLLAVLAIFQSLSISYFSVGIWLRFRGPLPHRPKIVGQSKMRYIWKPCGHQSLLAVTELPDKHYLRLVGKRTEMINQSKQLVTLLFWVWNLCTLIGTKKKLVLHSWTTALSWTDERKAAVWSCKYLQQASPLFWKLVPYHSCKGPECLK